jgi:hypothetical protein
MAIDEEPCHSLPTLEVAARLRGRVGSRVIVTMSLSLKCLSVLHSGPLVPACTQQPNRRGENIIKQVKFTTPNAH